MMHWCSNVNVWWIVTFMTSLCNAASVLPDNSIIWTAKTGGLFYFHPNNTNEWLFSPTPTGLQFGWVSLAPANEVFGMSYDYNTNQIIVSDPGQKHISLINLENQQGAPFHIGASPGVGQLTIDWRARNVYWTDAGFGWIAMKSFPAITGTVNSLDKGFRTIVDTFLDKPTGIIVYPLQHYLFWADAGEEPKIERSDLVGGNRTVLVYQGLISPTCLSIDNQTHRLFWSDPDRSTLEYINFDGTGRTVFASRAGYDFYGIAVFRERLIFTAPRINITGVYSLDNAFSGTFLDVGIPLYYVDVYDKETQPRSDFEPCDSQQIGCDQICVHMKADRGATCYCEDGFDLVGGNQCQAGTTVLERNILFTINNTICTTSINTIYSTAGAQTDCSVIEHTAAITKFAINMHDDVIFFTDGIQIYKQVAFSAANTLLYTSSSTVLDLDYDWRTQTLYWAEEGYGLLLYKTTNDPSVQANVSPIYQSSTLTITSVAVDPHNNHVYWIARAADSSFRLYSWNRGDNSVSQIVTSALSNPKDIEYDRRNDRLVWNDNQFYGIIRPDGTGIQRVDTYPDIGVRHGIAVYKKLVICTILDNMNHFDVYVDGSVGPPLSTRINQISLDEAILDVHVFDSTTQQDSLDPCDVDNNGCQHLCFPSDTTQCACNLGYELAANGKSCTSNVLSSNFSLVLDGLYGRIFQFRTNTRPVHLQIIELAPSNRPVAMTFDDARNTLTWVDGTSRSIRRINILEGAETTITGSDFLETSVIVVDARSGHTYVTKDRKVYVIDSGNQQRLILDETIIQSVIKSVAVSVDKGKLAWIETGSQSRIMRSFTNGSNVQTVVAFSSERIESPEVIKFDPANGDYIYWCDSVKDKIERIDNNLESTIIYENAKHNPIAFDVDNQYLYYIPQGQRSVFVIDKVTGQEVDVVMETPIIGAIFGIHVSKSVPTLPGQVDPTFAPEVAKESKLPVVPIAAGTGGGLVLLIIVLVVFVYCKRRKPEKLNPRRPSTLPTATELNPGIRNHGYDTFGGLSPDPPPRPLSKEEQQDGGVYHELDDVAFVDLPPKIETRKTQPRRDSATSDRYSAFPNQSDYLTASYSGAMPLPDYPETDYEGKYLDFSQNGRPENYRRNGDGYLSSSSVKSGVTGSGDDGYLMSSSVSNGSFNDYNRNLREARDFSDGSAHRFSRDPVPRAHVGGFHGSKSGSSGGSYNTGFIGRR